MLDINADWGSHGEECYALWKLEPCCGTPLNTGAASYCVICNIFCTPCVASRLMAASFGLNGCGIINHFACVMIPVIFGILVFFPHLIRLIFFRDDSVVKTFEKWIADAITIGLVFVCIILTVYVLVIIRVSFRRLWHIGNPNINFFDFICVIFFFPCQWFQFLRSAGPGGWDWLRDIQSGGITFKTGPFPIFPLKPAELGEMSMTSPLMG